MVSSYDSETVPWSYFWNRRKALLLLFLLLAPCFYWSHPLSCKWNSSSGLALLVQEEKEKVLSDFISLHCKGEVATLYMTRIPHRKVALTALLGYCLVSINKIIVLRRKNVLMTSKIKICMNIYLRQRL